MKLSEMRTTTCSLEQIKCDYDKRCLFEICNNPKKLQIYPLDTFSHLTEPSESLTEIVSYVISLKLPWLKVVTDNCRGSRSLNDLSSKDKKSNNRYPCVTIGDEYIKGLRIIRNRKR